MTDPIKQKIQELIPDAKDDFGIAVVLRAFQKGKKNPQSSLSVDSYGELKFYDFRKRKENKWDLFADNYDLQSEECKRFIGEILGVAPQKQKPNED